MVGMRERARLLGGRAAGQRAEPGEGTRVIARACRCRGAGRAVIRIVVVDDHPIVRQGLVARARGRARLRGGRRGRVGEEALALVARLRPDVVLLDLELPGLDGVEAIPRLLEAQPEHRAILVFTAYDTDERVLGAIRAGAAGYLLKGASADEIARGDAGGPRRRLVPRAARRGAS